MFTRFLTLYVYLWLRERSSNGSLIKVVFIVQIAPVSNLAFPAESRLYQWLRANTIDRLTIKPVDSLDVDADAALRAWQERQEAESAIRNYLDDMPSMPFTERCISVSFPTHSEHRVSPRTPG